MAQNSISSELNDLLITHDFDVAALSTKTGKPAVNERGVPDTSEADMFSFDWVGPTGKNYGTMVILLDQNGGMTAYFGDNLGRTMDPEDKKAWYGDSESGSPGFLEQLKNFAIRTSKVRGGFGLENLSKLKYAIAGQAALTESFYGTKKVSYSGQPTEARLMIRHTRPISEGDKRYRYVESLFIETVEGERFRLPFRKLAGGRAMLEHVRQGGTPYDMRGQHIADTVNQINVLSQFRRAHHGRVFEGAAGELVQDTNQYYQQLNHNLKHMATNRGYNSYFESWKPADISEGDIMVEDLRGMFVETRMDPRIELALPMLAKIQQEAIAMKEANIFESWATRLVEGTWSLPDTPEKMTQLQDWLSQPRPLGPDAEDVTDVLYDLIGDDALFDQLGGMAEEDPDADAVPIVQAWIVRNQDQSPELSELAMSFQTTQPAEPEAAPAPTEPAPVAEGRLNELSKDTLKAYSKERGETVRADQRDSMGAHIMSADAGAHGDIKKSAAWDDEASWLHNRAEKGAKNIAKATIKIAKKKGVTEGSGQKPTITYKDYTLQYDYQTEDDDPEGYSTATTYYFDVFKDGKRVGEAEYFDYFGNLKIRINGKTKEFGFRHPLASQISQLVSSLPDEQKNDLSDPKFESQGVAEGKPQKKADRYHINKDGKPATLASYPDKDSAVKDRDSKYPDAKVHQVGPRGKVKGEFEEGVAEGHQDDSKEREENLRYSRSRNPVADAIRKKLNPNQKEQNKEKGVEEGDNLQTFEDIIRLSGAPMNENVLNDSGSTLDYIIKTYQRDVKDFVQNGDMSEHLFDALYDYYQDDMPYGIKKARTGDPYEWIGQRFYDDLQGSNMMDEGWSIDMSPEEIQKGQDAVNAVAAQSGATAGGVQIGSTPPGINRLTGKPNAPAAPTPATPATPGDPEALKKHYQQNPLVRGIAPTAPVNECNYTMENEYCPVHGLEECSGTSMFESELARIKALMK